MKQELEKTCARVEVDSSANIYAYKESPNPGPSVVFAAHSDEIGVAVTSVETNGFLRLGKLGNVLDALQVSRTVRINGHLGVIGVKSMHLRSESERTQARKHTELYIDVGALGVEEAGRLGIYPKIAVALHSPLEFFANEDRFCAKALDDGLGCAVLLEPMRHVDPPAGTFVAAITVGEGSRAKKRGRASVNPTFVIALDTMLCGDTPDVNLHTELSVGIGLGPTF